MANRPEWLTSIINETLQANRPKWLRKQLELQRIDEEDSTLLTRAEAKAEGDFAAGLRQTIRKHEGGRHGYNAWFGRGTSMSPVEPPKEPTEMTVNEILEWQNTHNPPGSATTAIGAYQIVDQPNARTLSGLVRIMGLTGEETFTPELQDRMADTLMERRGLSKFLSGQMDGNKFANRIAREWASLPVLQPDTRRGRAIAVGQSYYAGDGINQAFKDPNEFEAYKRLYASADIETLGD